MRAFALLALLLGALACSKETPPPPASTPAPIASAAPVPPASASTAAAPGPSASAAASATPPTEEDFEDEATQAVTAKTLDSQLDALEKEIQAD